jgi:hypothetical protein
MADIISDFTKDPDATLDWHFDWFNWLQTSETITTSTYTVSPGLTIASTSNTTTNTTAWISGGQTSHVYTLTNRVVTNQGRTDERSIVIRVKDR